MATQLNDAAVEIVDELDVDQYRSPASVAAITGHDPAAVSGIFDRLHRRGFLEWRPVSDPSYTPPVSIVVTVRDDRENLERCLDALAALEYPTYEVVVVDDGSTDGTQSVLDGHPLAQRDILQVLRVGSEFEPLGIGASRNRGVSIASYDIIAFTDADCRPSRSWLRELVPFLAEVDGVGGRIRPVDGTARSRYEAIASSLDMGERPARVDPTGDTPYLATANLVGHRDLFESVPFPDRDVAEDVDVCWRAIEAGFDLVYKPSGLVEHEYQGGHVDMLDRRMVYGSSEALLARSYGRSGHRAVSLPVDGLLLALSGPTAVLSTGVLAMVATIALILATLLLIVRIGTSIARYRAVRRLVPPTTVLRSWGRTTLSIGYAIGREVTRYYLLPLAILAATASVMWPGAASGGLWIALLGVFGVPIGIEYIVQKPDTSLLAYASYYTVDHLGYQYGVYLGAIRYRTTAHIDPRSRFRVSWPLGPPSSRGRDDNETPVTSRNSV